MNLRIPESLTTEILCSYADPNYGFLWFQPWLPGVYGCFISFHQSSWCTHLGRWGSGVVEVHWVLLVRPFRVQRWLGSLGENKHHHHSSSYTMKSRYAEVFIFVSMKPFPWFILLKIYRDVSAKAKRVDINDFGECHHLWILELKLVVKLMEPTWEVLFSLDVSREVWWIWGVSGADFLVENCMPYVDSATLSWSMMQYVYIVHSRTVLPWLLLFTFMFWTLNVDSILVDALGWPWKVSPSKVCGTY